ncbi:MAG: enoyl-CoA hydratase [Deltaproteobacteria bacterium]|nr:MAG: enoyl-CoA hydratase [Deltaproteobacteria bacterium]
MVRTEREGPVTTVILDRAAVKNAVDRATAQELADAFRAFDADAGARVAVLYGDHGAFCAGADLKAMSTGAGNRVAPDGDGPMGPSRMLLTKPEIAAIAGRAVAGGGVPLIDGGTIRLPRLIGLSRALDLILTGRAVHADEALAIGLVNRVVPHGESLAAARALAHELAVLPQEALRADRMSAYLQHDLPLEDALAQELALGRHALAEAFAGAQRFAGGAGRHGGAA